MQSLETFAPPAAGHPAAPRLAAHTFPRRPAGWPNQAVAVLVENGRDTRIGSVDTWLGRTLAADEAGARLVNNELVLFALELL